MTDQSLITSLSRPCLTPETQGIIDAILKPKRTSVVTPDTEEELGWYYNHAAAELGEGSSFNGFVSMCVSGIPDGGNLSQVTKARMSMWRQRETAVEQQRRVALTLAQLTRQHRRVIRAHYQDNRCASFERRRMRYEDGGGDPVLSMLGPHERAFKELSAVVRVVSPALDDATCKLALDGITGNKGAAAKKAAANIAMRKAGEAGTRALRAAQLEYQHVKAAMARAVRKRIEEHHNGRAAGAALGSSETVKVYAEADEAWFAALVRKRGVEKARKIAAKAAKLAASLAGVA